MLVSRYILPALLLAAVCGFAQNDMPRPRAGKVEILKTSELKPGMKATAWTVFEGTQPEAVPVEI
ncbi:MAG: hypothetical protein JNL98_38640, partial [Bryobacterales bacterium]|nr:hypothetical protein [Bryobacterales bacterium]